MGLSFRLRVAVVGNNIQIIRYKFRARTKMITNEIKKIGSLGSHGVDSKYGVRQ
jgi:hypothetical protein